MHPAQVVESAGLRVDSGVGSGCLEGRAVRAPASAVSLPRGRTAGALFGPCGLAAAGGLVDWSGEGPGCAATIAPSADSPPAPFSAAETSSA